MKIVDLSTLPINVKTWPALRDGTASEVLVEAKLVRLRGGRTRAGDAAVLQLREVADGLMRTQLRVLDERESLQGRKPYMLPVLGAWRDDGAFRVSSIGHVCRLIHEKEPPWTILQALSRSDLDALLGQETTSALRWWSAEPNSVRRAGLVAEFDRVLGTLSARQAALLLSSERQRAGLAWRTAGSLVEMGLLAEEEGELVTTVLGEVAVAQAPRWRGRQ
jgi:hypothetical protein